MMVEKMGKSQQADKPFSALGTMLGLALVNQFVAVMVRPEMVMQAMRNGKLGPPSKPQVGSLGQEPASDSKPPDSSKPKWAYERKNVNKLIAYAVDPKLADVPSGERAGLVFERGGFADWNLTGIRLPVLK